MAAIELTTDGPVVIVTLNRPEQLNAANAALHTQITELWSTFSDRNDCRAIVLTGAGRAFSAGGDMPYLETLIHDPEERAKSFRRTARVVRDMLAVPQPIVAAVNGPAVGFGCTLALLCDMVVMAESAYLADPHVGVGVVAGDGAAVLWPHLVGMLRAKELLLTGARIPAARAEHLGLANQVVADGEARTVALEVAQRMAAMSPAAVQGTKRALNMTIERSLAGILDYGIAAEAACFGSPEHQAVVDRMLKR